MCALLLLFTAHTPIGRIVNGRLVQHHLLNVQQLDTNVIFLIIKTRGHRQGEAPRKSNPACVTGLAAMSTLVPWVASHKAKTFSAAYTYTPGSGTPGWNNFI